MSINDIPSHRNSAFILAGGKSVRMGTDKGLVDFKGKPMIKHLIEIVQPLFSDVIIISNNEAYQKFGLPVLKDRIKDLGPIGGLLTGLKYTNTDWNFFIACDLPFVQTKVINLLNDETYTITGWSHCVHFLIKTASLS
jgi:molybdopterin-guanine dinucleotide biosynthesis protein A